MVAHHSELSAGFHSRLPGEAPYVPLPTSVAVASEVLTFQRPPSLVTADNSARATAGIAAHRATAETVRRARSMSLLPGIVARPAAHAIDSVVGNARTVLVA